MQGSGSPRQFIIHPCACVSKWHTSQRAEEEWCLSGKFGYNTMLRKSHKAWRKTTGKNRTLSS